MTPVSVIIPVRNAERWIERCLDSVQAQEPSEIIVVDGDSSDRTRELALARGLTVLSDGGAGLPVARMMGVEAAAADLVALVDVDVELPQGTLAALVAEFEEGGYAGLQAGLESTSGPGYWGRALAEHHRTGRSRHWFGLVATLFRRTDLLEHGFDESFRSGEDIELRWRMRDAGLKLGVSKRTLVTHWFLGDDFAFAKGQFVMDGHGLGLMMRKHPRRAPVIALIPLAGLVRGIALTVARGKPQYVLYYLAYGLYNYAAMISGAIAGR